MLQKKFALSFSRNLTCRLAQAFLSEKKSDDHDLVFIRHAESMYNRACEEYRLAHGIPYAWKTLCSHEGFDERVLFNYEFVDTRLTDKGKQEVVDVICSAAKLVSCWTARTSTAC